MLEMLKKFEEEGVDDDLLGNDEEDDDDKDDLAKRLSNIDIGQYFFTLLSNCEQPDV